jgi:hypothetical protein
MAAERRLRFQFVRAQERNGQMAEESTATILQDMRSKADVHPTRPPAQIQRENTAAFSRAAAGVKPQSFEVRLGNSWRFQNPKEDP